MIYCYCLLVLFLETGSKIVVMETTCRHEDAGNQTLVLSKNSKNSQQPSHLFSSRMSEVPSFAE